MDRTYRHLEFQSEPHPEMARRCFRYVLQRAVAAIRNALPGARNPEALAILAYFAGAYSTVEELTRLFGRETMIQSSVWQAAWSEGKAESKAEKTAVYPLSADLTSPASSRR